MFSCHCKRISIKLDFKPKIIHYYFYLFDTKFEIHVCLPLEYIFIHVGKAHSLNHVWFSSGSFTLPGTRTKLLYFQQQTAKLMDLPKNSVLTVFRFILFLLKILLVLKRANVFTIFCAQ